MVSYRDYKKSFIYLISGITILILLASSVSAQSTSSSSPTPFAGFGLFLTIFMIYQINKSEKIAISEADEKRIGVAGWLLFFIGLLTISGFAVILRIISNIFQIIVYYHSLSLSLSFVFTEILDLATGVASVVAAYYLWKVKTKARWLVVGVLLFDILVIVVNWFISGTDQVYVALSFIGLIWDIIMITYFILSRRVKNTYAINAKIPKKSASSNKTVYGWIIFQAVMSIIFFAVFQFGSWTEIAHSAKDKQCTDYCIQYKETDSYYFGYDQKSGGLLCQCQKAGEVISGTTFPVANPTS